MLEGLGGQTDGQVDNLVSGQTLVELDKLQKKIVVTSQDAIAAGLR